MGKEENIKLRVTKDYPGINGMLYKGDIVLLPKQWESYANSKEKIKVQDMTGRLHFIEGTILVRII